MYVLLLIIHLITATVLIGVVMLQSGKAGDLASAFGGASSQTAFGVRSAATMLTKVTTVCAVLFMVTSLGLSILYTRGTGTSVMEQAGSVAEEQAVPASTPVAEEVQPPAGETQPAPAQTVPPVEEAPPPSGDGGSSQ